jgi:hypothetical protein
MDLAENHVRYAEKCQALEKDTVEIGGEILIIVFFKIPTALFP